jgi:SET family sugar efflux transporter-like MFS transporter
VTGGLAKRTLIGTTVAFVVVQSVTSLTVTTMPLFISVNLHGSVSSAGFVLGLCAAIEVPLMLLFGSMASRWPVHRLLFVGGGFGMAYCLAVSLADTVWQVAIAQVLHACFVCAFGGLGISYFQELMPSALGRATTLYTNSARMSGMLAGVVFGVVQLYGYRWAYVMAFGLCVLGTAILAITRRRGAPMRHTDAMAAPSTA